jgi:glyoxalase
MRLEHVAVYVSYLEGAKDFFMKYFGAHPSSIYHNTATGFKSYFLQFDSGARLEIMTRPDLHPQNDSGHRSGYVHIALSAGSRHAVDSMTARLRADGYQVISGPRTTGDGYYESQIAGFEGNIIEITV